VYRKAKGAARDAELGQQRLHCFDLRVRELAARPAQHQCGHTLAPQRHIRHELRVTRADATPELPEVRRLPHPPLPEHARVHGDAPRGQRGSLHRQQLLQVHLAAAHGVLDDSGAEPQRRGLRLGASRQDERHVKADAPLQVLEHACLERGSIRAFVCESHELVHHLAAPFWGSRPQA
jgi:hypothetical protein